MDPYLEDGALWPLFHCQLVTCLYQTLLHDLMDRYRALVNKRHYVAELDRTGSVVREEYQEDFIEIRQRTDARLITLVDVVSPANKLTLAGRSAYLAKRSECKSVNANLVELDLVLQGQPTLEYSRDGLHDCDYAVSVMRSTQPERYEIYPATLKKRLPRFRLPLAPDDRDTVLDLQTAFTRCYDQGCFAAKINYAKNPFIPLDEDDSRWLNGMLVAQYLRKLLPSHDEIADEAYRLWEQEGHPHGRDKEHWKRASEYLRSEMITGE